MFGAQGPTPAVWSKGGTLSSVGGPCVSGASWSALLKLASVPSNEARWSINGFGAFCSTQRLCPSGRAKQQARVPGRNPATPNTTMTRELVKQVRREYLPTLGAWQNSRWISNKHR